MGLIIKLIKTHNHNGVLKMNDENIVLDGFIGKVRSYGMDIPASLNDAGDKIIYLTGHDNRRVAVSMDLFMRHRLFTTFSPKTQLQLNHWFNE